MTALLFDTPLVLFLSCIISFILRCRRSEGTMTTEDLLQPTLHVEVLVTGREHPPHVLSEVGSSNCSAYPASER